jgi:hypothetical protein
MTTSLRCWEDGPSKKRTILLRTGTPGTGRSTSRPCLIFNSTRQDWTFLWCSSLQNRSNSAYQSAGCSWNIGDCSLLGLAVTITWRRSFELNKGLVETATQVTQKIKVSFLLHKRSEQKHRYGNRGQVVEISSQVYHLITQV